MRRDEARPEEPDIRTLVREGDELLVQVVKDPLGTKGARLSTHVSLPSRYLVYMPRGARVGVSSRIESGRGCASNCASDRRRWPASRRAARRRLHRAHRGAGCAGWKCWQADMHFLRRLWAHVRETLAGDAAPASWCMRICR